MTTPQDRDNEAAQILLVDDDEAVREGSSSGSPVKGDEPLAAELRELVPNLFPSSRRR